MVLFYRAIKHRNYMFTCETHSNRADHRLQAPSEHRAPFQRPRKAIQHHRLPVTNASGSGNGQLPEGMHGSRGMRDDQRLVGNTKQTLAH